MHHPLIVLSDDIMLTSEGVTGSVDRSGQPVTISVLLSSSDAMTSAHASQHQQLIGRTCVSGRTKWDTLDSIVRRAFKVFS